MDFNKTGIKNTLIKKYNIQPTAIIRLDGFYDANYKIFTFQRNYFFKIYGIDKLPSVIFQVDFINKSRLAGLSVAKIIRTLGNKYYINIQGYYAVLQEYIEGEQLSELNINKRLIKQIGEILGRLHKLTYGKKFLGKSWKKYVWDLAQFSLVVSDYLKIKNHLSPDLNNLVEPIIGQWKLKVKNLDKMRKGVVHNDYHHNNILIKKDKVVGIIDFGDSIYSWFAGDLAIALSHLNFNNKENFFRLIKSFLTGYEKNFKLNRLEKNNLIFLIKMRAVGAIIEITLLKKQKENLYKKILKSQIKVLKYLKN
jgi:Ser/Thr protein kinase RdoA (MazF antagonist)